MNQIELKLSSPINTLKLESRVSEDEITEKISQMFDYSFKGGVEETIEIPQFPKEFEIGVIVGSSGSGKSTILRSCFGEEEKIDWDCSKAIASHFNSFEEASSKFGAVGLNSIPAWLKPYNVLSNGEKFRANMARRLKDGAVIDEFTSVVNREVAMSCSTSISKYIRKNQLKNIVFCSCHDDILPYLSPTWIYNTDTHAFYNGRYLCRPKINIEINYCRKEVWDQFRRYHYLSGDLNKSANCYVATLDKIPVGFVAILSFPRKGLDHGFREHRVVIHPDYQGMGIGNKLSEAIGQAYIEKGCRYFAKTSNPRMGIHRDNSKLWRATSHNHKARKDYKRTIERGVNEYSMSEEMLMRHMNRVCYCHEYIGDGTIYPYTLSNETTFSTNEEIGQMSIFDFIERTTT